MKHYVCTCIVISKVHSVRKAWGKIVFRVLLVLVKEISSTCVDRKASLSGHKGDWQQDRLWEEV